MIHRFFVFLAWLHGNGKTPCHVCREWHSFWIGWSESICFFVKPYFIPTLLTYLEMDSEWHYYTIGRAMGIITWFLLGVGIYVIVK